MVSTVTICGVDDSVLPEDLVDLSARFPFVEWCVNLSSDSSQARPGYPSPSWLDELASKSDGLRLLGNLQGRWEWDILTHGNLSFRAEKPELWHKLKRIRIDLTPHIKTPTLIRALRLINKEVVIATKESLNPILDELKTQNISITVLDIERNILDANSFNTLDSHLSWVVFDSFRAKDGITFDLDSVEECLDFLEDYVDTKNWVGGYLETSAGQRHVSSMRP